uniref:MPK16 n=1 Tax=Arundo donax TaxID=35708 RepID=A0A0A9GD82_ARUDO
MLQEYLCGGDTANFVYPSGVDRFKRQFAHLEEGAAKGEKTSPQLRQHASLPREKVNGKENELEKPNADYVIKLHVCEQPAQASVTDGLCKPLLTARNFLKSESIGASQCVVIKQKRDKDEESEYMNAVDGVPQKIAQLKT